ncbi:MAG: PAS domain S-box-containing protein, partial [Halobacteriales archaeon]
MNRERFEDARPLLDRITDAFFAVDDRWRFTYVNDRAEEMFDRSREDLLGRVIWDEFPETVETQFPDSFYQAMERQEPVSFEVYHTPLETWFEVNAFPSEDGLSVYMQDVTDEKRRQKDLDRYESIVEG